jgi:hypothetical protein
MTVPNPIETLDLCSARLARAQDALAKTRKLACVVSGLIVVGGFGLLVAQILRNDAEPNIATPPDGDV